MDTAKVFNNGRSQAVRLPKAYRFDADEVYITRVGDVVVLSPTRKGWELLAKGAKGFTEDFMAQRRQPAAAEERAPL